MKVDNSKIAILGNGFVAQGYKRMLPGAVIFNRDDLDVTKNSDNTSGVLRPLLDNFDIVINCIAITSNIECEKTDYFGGVLHVNGIWPGILSNYCKDNHKKLVHISTGCVYSGLMQTEKSIPLVGNKYTQTKLIGDNLVDDPSALVLRPRLVHDNLFHSNNFVCKLDKFTSVSTNHESVTSMETLVNSTLALLRVNQSGIFNICETEPVFWPDIFDKLFPGKQFNYVSSSALGKALGMRIASNTMNNSKLREFYTPHKSGEKSIIDSYLFIKNNK